MKRKYKIALIIISAIIISFLICFYGSEYIRNYFFRLKLGSIPEIPSGSKILVVAPHCDDETLGTGELISTLSKKGVDFKIVLMTNGDGFTDAVDLMYHEIKPRVQDYIKFGSLRQGETVSAMNLLGISRDKILFLGYPDGGLYTMWNQEHWDIPYESIHTKASKSPYSNSYTPNTTYTGKSVVGDLVKIISSYSPDYIFYPHPNDRHPDHLASYCFTKYVLNQLNLPVKEYLYLVHRGDWPVITPHHERLFLVPPSTLVYQGVQWYGYDLTPIQTQEKTEAINKYISQVEIMGSRLRAFSRKNELFAYYGSGILMHGGNNADYRKYMLDVDPTSDILLSSIQGGGDLKTLYGYADTDGSFKFYIETRENIKNDITFIFDMVVYTGGIESGRITASVKDGSIVSAYTMGGTKKQVTGITCSIKAKILKITVPQNYVQGSSRYFIGVSTNILGTRLDSMAWRMYDLK